MYLGAQNFVPKPSRMSKTLGFGRSTSVQGELPVLLLSAQTCLPFLDITNSWLLLIPGTSFLLFMTSSSKVLSSNESWTSFFFGLLFSVSVCRVSPLPVGDLPGRILGPLYLTRLMRR
nr:hypothetical protein Iba_chr01aCG15230 [Ipomoea batatas]GMC50305.1 hypothetical protein Iba_chr01bCG15760 [Ipomoea batatas]GMC54172.1 hypothetical protein Iba_chr01dCG13640 [Ipomoea batatas]